MRFWHCRGCEGRDQEIKHLLGQLERVNTMLEKAHARVIEVADPGANSRAAFAEREPVDRRPRAPIERPPSFPGYPPAKPKQTVEVAE